MNDEPKKRDRFVNTPFRYPGNQIYTLDLLLSLIPPHDSYVEPFCGGASVFLGKKKARTNHLNDVDTELIETYKAIRDHPEKLIAKLKTLMEGEYHEIRESIPENKLEVAARWFYLNKTSRIENMSMEWVRDETTLNDQIGWGESISKCSLKLQGVSLTTTDFEDPISKAQRGSFAFIAPPYSIRKPLAEIRKHKYPFHRESHYRLARLLKDRDHEIKFMVTYDDQEELREMYSWGDHIKIQNIPNKLPLKDEIIITNYQT